MSASGTRPTAAVAERGQVLVTGGSGFIAAYCIAQLLDAGWGVRTTVRDLSKETKVRKGLAKLTSKAQEVRFLAADLIADDGWQAATRGCDFVLHVASPLPSTSPQTDDELIRPARDGALRVLKAARDGGVKRVVMTASTASLSYGHGSREAPFTEADWSDVSNRKDTSGYERSKTLAERAAWDWLMAEGGGLELTTICPGAVLGPVFSDDYSASIDIVKRLVDGSLPGLPRYGWPLVDVRDIADLHLRAMTTPIASGQRYIGAGPFFWMSDMAQVLSTQAPQLAKGVPTRALSDGLVRLFATFNAANRGRLYELGKKRPVSAEKAKRELGWAPRSNEDAIIATAESLVTAGIVRS